MSDKLVDKITGILPEFYVDVIARIIPGFLISTLFFNTMKSIIAEYGGFIAMLIISYAIGFVIDILGNLFIQIPFTRFLVGHWHKLSDKDIWKSIWSSPSDQRALLIKLMAEKTFFRSLLLVSAAFYFLTEKNMIKVPIPPYLFLVMSIFFLLCNFRMHLITLSTLDSIKNKMQETFYKALATSRDPT